jgi:hypothetical protein
LPQYMAYPFPFLVSFLFLDFLLLGSSLDITFGRHIPKMNLKHLFT